MSDQEPFYRQNGFCPICEAPTEYTAKHNWYRDHLFCALCKSVPRERAVALMLLERLPHWRELAIHESSPTGRGVSVKMRQQGKHYTATQYFPDRPSGEIINGYRNENLEQQTFADAAFDLVVTLDVMEHVNKPELCVQEIYRTLKSGGLYIFTAPTYKHRVESVRRALFKDDGSIEHYAEPPEYHGNPVDPNGSLVTFHYGYDLPTLIAGWAPFDVRVTRFHDPWHGIMGEHTETYLCEKRA